LKNPELVFDFLTIILYLGTALLLLLYNLKRPSPTRIYLIIAFLLTAGSFSLWLATEFSSFVLIPLIREYLFALGLVFFTTVVVGNLFPYPHLSFYYLLTSLGLTSIFSALALADLNLKLTDYSAHWSFPVWLVVQIVILGVLSYFLIRSALKTKKRGPIVYTAVFLLFLSERLIEGMETYILKEFFEPEMLIERCLHLLAALLVFTYAAYGLVKISLEEKGEV